MRYAEVIPKLYALSPRGMRLGLGRMQRACALRGHPQHALPVVHVAGTNGKGSVVALLASSLGEAGVRVGAFTSPHLHSYTERFRIDGEPVSRRTLAAHASELLAWLAEPGRPRLTFFEVSTLLAFEIFRDAGCQLSLIEVGLGGRLDSTNVVSPVLSVITSIGVDHADRLGSTLGEIATEKAGILKPAVPAVVRVRGTAARRAIAARARAVSAGPVRWAERDFGHEAGAHGLRVWCGEDQVSGLRPALPGAHQQAHAATAFACLSALDPLGFQVSPAAFRRGVARTRWPGRLEWLKGTPRVLLDAAHNPDGARSLAAYLQSVPPAAGPRVLVFGAMADKQAAAMLRVLRPHVDHLVLTAPPGARAADPATLTKRGDRIEEDPLGALRLAERLAGRRGQVVVAGSLFLVAAVRARKLGLRAEPAIRL